MNAALILSGGSGQRFQSALPKQYHKILKKPVIEYVIEAVLSAESIDLIMIAGHDAKPLSRLIEKYPGIRRVPGGAKRNETLKIGLDALNESGTSNVIILDAVRPLVTGKLIDEYMRILESGYDAVSTVQPITDSLGCLDMHAVDRSRYYLMQSPEAYRLPLLHKYFDPASHLTEVAHQLPESAKVYLYKDFPENPKLTYPWEKSYIANALKARCRK